jgi:hypothetical protein
MEDLNEWLDCWRPIRAGFEQWSLKTGSVAICHWASGDDLEAYRRFYDLRPGEHLRLGLVSAQQKGSIAWCLLHEGVARAAQGAAVGTTDLGAEIAVANKTCDAFKLHAEHAGNLLLEAPPQLQFKVAEEWTGFRGLKLWIAALFGEADQPPNYMIGTQPYRPLWCDALTWPYEIQTLVDNPFLASVKFITLLRLATTQGILNKVREDELAHARTEGQIFRGSGTELVSRRQSEIAQNPRPRRRAMNADEVPKAMEWIGELVPAYGETEAIHRVEARTSEPPPRGFGRTISASTLRRAWKKNQP